MRQSERSLGASAASALGLLRTSNIAAISCHRWQLAGHLKTAPLALIVTFEKPDREEQVGRRATARRLRSCRPLGDVDHDRCRSLVEEALDELDERVRILKACPWVESSDLEEFSVALDAPIYPPRPDLLAFSPASDFHSGHAGLLLLRRWKSALPA